MKVGELNACLVVLLVAVRVSLLYGYDIFCTSNDDCKYTHGRCYIYSQCTRGLCRCKPGFFYSNTGIRCKTLKKIGETCFDSLHACHGGGHCYNTECMCLIGKASDDKKSCGRHYGETCSADNDCHTEHSLSCKNGTCVCSIPDLYKKVISTKPYMKIETVCVLKQQSSATVLGNCRNGSTYCEPGLICAVCPGGAPGRQTKCMSDTRSWLLPPSNTGGKDKTTPSSGKKPTIKRRNKHKKKGSCATCLKGASVLSVGLLVTCGLLVNVFLTKFH